MPKIFVADNHDLPSPSRKEENAHVSYLQRKDASKRTVTPTHKVAQTRTTKALERIVELEDLLKVERSWTPEDEEYKKAAASSTIRVFRRAGDLVEKLFVQRCFEMQKVHLVSTCESH